jgi:predicted AAA+ superfamily ATPase
MEKRYIYQALISKFLKMKQMIFIAGPRQSGKTTLAKMVADGFERSLYFNWDIATDRKKLRATPYFYEQMDRPSSRTPVVIFDEIHKFSQWKNYLKGAYDRSNADFKFLVTGSGRLDAFRKGGDSLAGRYFLVHVWPFTVAELAGTPVGFDAFWKSPIELESPNTDKPTAIWENLEALSGFPTPYLSGSREIYRAWSDTYRNQLIREDIRDLSGIVKIDLVEALVDLLPGRIGNPLSTNSLAKDLEVSFDSVKSWIEILDRFYLTFRVAPYSKRVARAITKEKKLYLFDYSQIEDPAKRFENMVAVELLRAVTTWTELGYGRFGLSYVRNKEKEECDFLITERQTPKLLIECKLSDPNVGKSLVHFQRQLQVPAVQLVRKPGVRRLIRNDTNSIGVFSAADWLSRLP